MDGYEKLNFIDKIRFRWRVRQEEKLEDKRQSIEHDDRMPIDKQKIINELLAERENKKNKAKSLPAPKKETLPVENKLNQYKVPSNTIKSPIEMEMEREKERLELLLSKELNSKIDAYENIIDLKSFLDSPHDSLPNAKAEINKKLLAIKNILGGDVLNKGLKIYENDKSLQDMYNVISYEDRENIRKEIMNNPELSTKLTKLRYNPDISQKQTGSIVKYQSVYSDMMLESKNNKYNSHNKQNENSNEKTIE